MKNTPVINSSYGSCSYRKMTGPLTACLPSKNFIFGHAHWIPLIEKWGKSLGKNNFPHYLPFQDALQYISHSVGPLVGPSVGLSYMQCEFTPNSDVTCISAPAHPEVTDVVMLLMYTVHGLVYKCVALYHSYWDYHLFLDASTYLYERVCPLVGRLVCRSVFPSVHWSVRQSVRQSVR